jgi:hypothetical protein
MKLWIVVVLPGQCRVQMSFESLSDDKGVGCVRKF